MSASVRIPPDQLIDELRILCAQQSSVGQLYNLAVTADLVADLLRRSGLETRIERTAGAPLVIGRRVGRSPFTLLLYHHYDVAPPGPWRAWSHEPFRLAEREATLYGRGVAHGKGPLIAHLQALRALLQADAELPCGVVVVVDGEALNGSPHLADFVAAQHDDLRADACLASGGERDAQGIPFGYAGSKGLLQVQLAVQGPAEPLPAGMAPTIRNPIWRLAWALNAIKSEDEEVRIGGFYDQVVGPSRSENATLRKAHFDEAGRLASWAIPEFLFGMSGPALVQAEITLPTCNLSSFSSEPATDLPTIPARAVAHLDFQLVPDQYPDKVLDLLREHLDDRSFADVTVQALGGFYRPAQTPLDHPFIHQLAAAGTSIYGQPLAVLPLGPFTQPLHIFAARFGLPVAGLACARHTSAPRGPDENLLLEDLLQHGHTLIALMHTCSGGD